MAIGSFVMEYLLSLVPAIGRRESASMLEFGEAETCRLDLAAWLDRVGHLTNVPVNVLQADLAHCRNQPANEIRFAEARLIYRWVFGCDRYRPADMDARDPRYRVDLNYSFDLNETFDVVVNNGTSEHVFNQANVFEMIHRHVKPGGLMVHYTPGLGWIDHGFYNVQPTFFFDLAKYNDYEVISCVLASDSIIFPLVPGRYSSALIGSLSDLANSHLCACLRRRSEKPFRYPTQYAYSNQ